MIDILAHRHSKYHVRMSLMQELHPLAMHRVQKMTRVVTDKNRFVQALTPTVVQFLSWPQCLYVPTKPLGINTSQTLCTPVCLAASFPQFVWAPQTQLVLVLQILRICNYVQYGLTHCRA